MLRSLGGAPPAAAVVASAAAAGVVQAPAAYTQVVEPYSQVGAAKAKAGREGGGEQCGTEQETEQECWPTQSQSICLYLSEFKTNKNNCGGWPLSRLCNLPQTFLACACQDLDMRMRAPRTISVDSLHAAI